MIFSKNGLLFYAFAFILSNSIYIVSAKITWNLDSVKPIFCHWDVNLNTNEYCLSVFLNVSRFPCTTKMDPNTETSCKIQQKILRGKLCCLQEDSLELKLSYQDVDSGNISGVIKKSDYLKIKNDIKEIGEFRMQEVELLEESSWSSWKMIYLSVFSSRWYNEIPEDNVYLHGLAILTRTVIWNKKIMGREIMCTEEGSNWMCTQSTGEVPIKIVRNIEQGSIAGLTIRFFLLNAYIENANFWFHQITYNLEKEEDVKAIDITNNFKLIKLWNDEARLGWTNWNPIEPKADNCAFLFQFNMPCIKLYYFIFRTITSTLKISLPKSTCINLSTNWVCKQQTDIFVPDLLCFKSKKTFWAYRKVLVILTNDELFIVQKIADQCGFKITNPKFKETCSNPTGWSLLQWKVIDGSYYNKIQLKENGVPAVANYIRHTTCSQNVTSAMFKCTQNLSLWNCNQLAHSINTNVFQTTTSNNQTFCKLYSILKDYTPHILNNKIEFVVTKVLCPKEFTQISREAHTKHNKNDLMKFFILILIAGTILIGLANAFC